MIVNIIIRTIQGIIARHNHAVAHTAWKDQS